MPDQHVVIDQPPQIAITHENHGSIDHPSTLDEHLESEPPSDTMRQQVVPSEMFMEHEQNQVEPTEPQLSTISVPPPQVIAETLETNASAARAAKTRVLEVLEEPLSENPTVAGNYEYDEEVEYEQDPQQSPNVNPDPQRIYGSKVHDPREYSIPHLQPFEPQEGVPASYRSNPTPMLREDFAQLHGALLKKSPKPVKMINSGIN